MTMNRSVYEKWLGTLSDRASALLAIMHSLSISMRMILVDYPDDADRRWRLAYKISEMNHAFTSAARSAIHGRLTYPDNVLVDILLEHPDNPELEHHGWIALEDAFRVMT